LRGQLTLRPRSHAWSKSAEGRADAGYNHLYGNCFRRWAGTSYASGKFRTRLHRVLPALSLEPF
jgi:hypothetical protein